MWNQAGGGGSSVRFGLTFANRHAEPSLGSWTTVRGRAFEQPHTPKFTFDGVINDPLCTDIWTPDGGLDGNGRCIRHIGASPTKFWVHLTAGPFLPTSGRIDPSQAAHISWGLGTPVGASQGPGCG